MYILLEDNKVKETIPDIDPTFPGVPIEERYAPDFVQGLLHVPDELGVQQNWKYDAQARTFAAPHQEEEAEETEEIESEE